MLHYPAMYAIITAPGLSARLAESFNHPFPTIVIYIGCTIYHLETIANVLVYTTTRKGFTWSWLGWTEDIMNIFTRIHPRGNDKLWPIPEFESPNDYQQYKRDFRPLEGQKLLGYYKGRKVMILLDGHIGRKKDEDFRPTEITIGSKQAFILGTIEGSRTTLTITEECELYAYTPQPDKKYLKYFHSPKSELRWKKLSFDKVKVKMSEESKILLYD